MRPSETAASRVEHLPSSQVVFQSWQRSAVAGVSPDAPATFRRIPDEELRERRSANRDLIDVAVPHLRWLAEAFAHRPRVAYLVDRDGIVLHAEGDERAIKDFGLSPGFDWSETTMGTSGAGTALAAKRPVAIIGCDHWSAAWAAATCLGAPIHDRAGQIVGAIDLSLDVRADDADRLVVPSYAAYAISLALAHRQTEAELRLSNAHLHQKDMFLATLGHELRQPLAAMQAALGLMRGRPTRVIGERARSVVERQIEHLGALLDDLLEADHIARGKTRLDRQRLNLDEFLATVIEAVALEADRRGLHVEFSRPDSTIEIRADPRRLRQVFSNLLTNAMKFTPIGGKIAISAERDANWATVTIRDTGRGIAPRVLPHIFELFAQADPMSGGLGIGLAVVRGLVEAHGGTVEARSRGENHGSEFIVSLPASH